MYCILGVPNTYSALEPIKVLYRTFSSKSVVGQCFLGGQKGNLNNTISAQLTHSKIPNIFVLLK